MSASSSSTQSFLHPGTKATNTINHLKPPIEVTVDSRISSMIVSVTGDILIGLLHGGILVIDAETDKLSYRSSGEVHIEEPEFSDEECFDTYYEFPVDFQLESLIELRPNVVCAVSHQEIRILDLAQDQCLRSLTGHRRAGSISVLSTTKGNIFTASSFDTAIRVENPDTGALLWSVNRRPLFYTGVLSLFWPDDIGSIFTATRLPNGDIACGTTEGFIFTMDSESGRYKKIFKGYEGEKAPPSGIDWCQLESKRINQLVVLPNNDLVSGSQNGPLYIWNQSTGKIKHRLVTGSNVNFHVSDLKTFDHYIFCLSNAVLYIWDGLTGEFMKEVTSLSTVLHDFALTREGEILIRNFPCGDEKCHIYKLPLSWILAQEQQSIPFRRIPFPKESIVMESQPICSSSERPSL